MKNSELFKTIGEALLDTLINYRIFFAGMLIGFLLSFYSVPWWMTLIILMIHSLVAGYKPKEENNEQRTDTK